VAISLGGFVVACGPWLAVRAANDAPDERAPIRIEGDYSQEWTTDGEAVAILRGKCRISQGSQSVVAEKAVVWLRQEGVVPTGATTDRPTVNGPRQSTLTAYFEENVVAGGGDPANPDAFRTMAFRTSGNVDLQIGRRIEEPDGPLDPLYQRAEERRDSRARPVQQAQFLDRFNSPAAPGQGPPPGPPGGGSEIRRVRIFPRSAVPYNVLSYQNAKTTPPEQIWVLTGGVSLLVDGVQQFGTVDLAADRMVIWTQMAQEGEEFRAETLQTRDTPFQVYLEGNIVIRQGRNVVRAAQAVYDAREDRGLLHNAELRSFVPELDGNVRLRAEQIRQLSQKSFQAKNAWTTGSQFGQPGYRLQSSEVFLDYRVRDPWIGTGRSTIDPLTGAPQSNEVPWVTSLDNTVYLENAPVGFVPYISGPVENPNVPLKTFSFQQDRILGTQVRTAWDVFQLLGMTPPRGGELLLNLDYFSERGPGIGLNGKYAGQNLGGVPGRYFGDGLGYYIHDTGKDNLGADRRSLEPPRNDRGRLSLHHRHEFPDDLTLLAEIGLLSDRNFLEQYYEKEFDRQKDVETLLYLNKRLDNVGLSGLVRANPTDFEYQTQWLPRGDLYVLSEPLLGGALTWSSHTSAGYAHLQNADRPTDPQDLFTPIPFFTDAEGVVAMTRHELNAPFNLGPIQVVPYVMGEAAYWGDDFTGDSLDRFVANAGVRGSVMFTRIFPYVRSDVFGLDGLAHKIRLEAEYSWIDSTTSLSQVPQYNEFDDNAQERFRERLVVNTFNGVLPPTFESRFYAVRNGAGATVTAPYHELIDDQQVARLAIRQRLQTKVGPPDRRRVRDWMLLDLEAAVFPDATRDNFGETLGLLGAKYAWNVSERTTLLASAFYDLFDDAQQLWTLGINSQRSERGSVFVGLRQVKGGNLDSEILTASYSYRMSEKWISTMGTAYDIKESRNVGQSLTITRVGADFLFHLGANYDTSKNNAGIAIAVEPRFGGFGGGGSGFNNPQLSNLLGATR